MSTRRISNHCWLAMLLLAATQLQAVAQEQESAVYIVDTENSRADILVFKAGKLARFGHDHLISTTGIEGSITIPPAFADSTAELVVKLDTLEVDREELLHEYGIDTKLSRSAKMGTRMNMLDKVLESGAWPEVSISASVKEAGTGQTVLDIGFRLHGVERKFELPVSLLIDATQIHVQGAFALQQTDYGIKPFSRMAGAMRVQDGVRIHFNLVAIRP